MPNADIHLLFSHLNQKYFEGTLACHLSWGREPTTRKVRTRRLGSYHPQKKKIVLHPLLKHTHVPLYVLASILHHEMCHAYIPPRRERRMLIAHGPDFKKKEREFEMFREAREWIKKNRAFVFGKTNLEEEGRLGELF